MEGPVEAVRADLRPAVPVGPEDDDAVAARWSRDRSRGRPDRPLRDELPPDDGTVARSACVQAVAQQAVEVVVVADDGRAELHEVEVRVPAHERIGGPLCSGDPARERPGPLELLQRVADGPAPEARIDARDVRVEVELRCIETDEAEGHSDELLIVVGAGHEAACVRERAQQRRGRLGLTVVPDALDQRRRGFELRKRIERPDDDAGPCRRAARCFGRMFAQIGSGRRDLELQALHLHDGSTRESAGHGGFRQAPPEEFGFASETRPSPEGRESANARAVAPPRPRACRPRPARCSRRWRRWSWSSRRRRRRRRARRVQTSWTSSASGRSELAPNGTWSTGGRTCVGASARHGYC